MAGSDITSDEASLHSVILDRRNEFYSLKRFVFISLGIPQAPAVQPTCGRICTCFAIILYSFLFIWGLGIAITSVIVEGFIWNQHCSRFLPARILSFFGGIFFLLLGAYWVALLCWHKLYKSHTEAHHKNFAPMASLFWLLTIIFTVITTALVAEILHNIDIVFSMGNAEDNFVDCGGDMGRSQTDVIHVPNNFMPVITLCSLLLLLVKYLCIAAVLTVPSFHLKHRSCCSCLSLSRSHSHYDFL